MTTTLTSKVVQVRIQGVTSLLQHRFSEEEQAASGASTRRVQLASDLPREAAEKGAYRGSDGNLWHPGAAIARLLRDAGSAHKQKGSRKSIKYVVPAAVIVLDDEMPLYGVDDKADERINDFEVDSRPVVIPATKGRIMRHRPRHDTWSIKFNLRLNEAVLPEEVIHELLVEGGQQIGIGDYRPEKGGPFGVFRLTSWEPLSDE